MLLSRTSRALIGGLYGNKSLYEEISDKAAPSDYDEILKTLDKKDKTPFEQFITTKDFNLPWNRHIDIPEDNYFYDSYWNRSLLLDNKASYNIRNYQLSEALATLKQIPETYWNEYPQSSYNGGNPFYVNIHRLHRMGQEDSARWLNKKEVIEEMIRLQTLAERDPSKAGSCYYQLGNAWFNMSWYGKNWLMVRPWWSSSEVYSGDYRKKASQSDKDYYGCEQARKYYQKAMVNTDNKQLAALCFFMKEECNNYWKKFQFYQGLSPQDYRRYERGNILNKKLARKQAVDMDYYTSLVEECELYQSFSHKFAERIEQ